jgi:hypothetical protein
MNLYPGSSIARSPPCLARVERRHDLGRNTLVRRKPPRIGDRPQHDGGGLLLGHQIERGVSTSSTRSDSGT